MSVAWDVLIPPARRRLRSLSLPLPLVRVYLWADGHRRFGITVDCSDWRNAL
jgi:hypothetical protein